MVDPGAPGLRSFRAWLLPRVAKFCVWGEYIDELIQMETAEEQVKDDGLWRRPTSLFGNRQTTIYSAEHIGLFKLFH